MRRTLPLRSRTIWRAMASGRCQPAPDPACAAGLQRYQQSLRDRGQSGTVAGSGRILRPKLRRGHSRVKRTSLVSNADISYRLTTHAAIGVTGGYQQFNYDNVDNGQLATADLIQFHGRQRIRLTYRTRSSRRQTLGSSACLYGYLQLRHAAIPRSGAGAPAV